MKIQIEKSEAAVTQSCTANITVADIRKAFKLPDDALITFVNARGSAVIEGDEVLSCEWVETKVRKPRAKKEAKAE